MSSYSSPVTDSLTSAILEYQAATEGFSREVARALAVNASDLRCLALLLRSETDAAAGAGSSPRRIADALGLTTGSVTTLLDRLESAGLVSRVQHPSDRRRSVISLTAMARRQLTGLLEPLLDETVRTALRGYSVAELEAIHRFFTEAAEIQQRHTDRLHALPTD